MRESSSWQVRWFWSLFLLALWILEDLVFPLWTSWYEGGHVLGLRIQRAARIVEVTMRARQALVYEREAGHRLASNPAVGTGEQATGRVDVPGEAHNELYKQNVAAAPFPVAFQHASVLTERYGGCLEKWEKDSSLFQIFVRDLIGKSVSLRVPSQITGDELSITVSDATGVPPEFFYLTIGGHIVGGRDLLGSFGAFPGSTFG